MKDYGWLQRVERIVLWFLVGWHISEFLHG